jgi:GH25 family lysozyme M1 (1,4-beta-N-acetylmuramidase)
MIQGYDISSYQGVVPQAVFTRLASIGWFVMIRANEGTPNSSTVLNIDPQFRYNINMARQEKCLTGVYHFSYPTLNSAQSEADYFASIYTPQEGEIIGLDFETPIGGSTPTQANAVWAKEWLDAVAAKFNGIKGLQYMDLSLANSLDWSPVSDAGYGLWLADWTGDPNKLGKANNWSFIAMSQFSDQAVVPEINGRVDQDAFYGDAAQFKAYGYHSPASVSNPTKTIPSTDADAEEITSLQAQLTKLQEELDSLQKEYELSQATITSLNSKVSNLTTSNTTLAERNAELVKQYGSLTRSTPVSAPVSNTSFWHSIVDFFRGL